MIHVWQSPKSVEQGDRKLYPKLLDVVPNGKSTNAFVSCCIWRCYYSRPFPCGFRVQTFLLFLAHGSIVSCLAHPYLYAVKRQLKDA